ncbi:lipase family protein [Corynebacterium suedekumii]|nr:lipase family protein [Corynebacterium suedekumii]
MRTPLPSSVVDPFYSPPAAVPAAPGTVLRTQPTQHLFNILGPDFPGHATRMLYTTLTEADEPVAASGTVIEPTRPWSGQGPTPTVVIAPGTRGQADSCAPSQGPLMTGNMDIPEQTAAFNYDLVSVYWATAAGMRVIVPDYIGLGTPGIHTYVNTWESARAVLDGARAGLAVAGVPDDSPVGFYGYSQGGGAAAGAAELHATYAPELNLRGTLRRRPTRRPRGGHARGGPQQHRRRPRLRRQRFRRARPRVRPRHRRGVQRPGPGIPRRRRRQLHHRLRAHPGVHRLPDPDHHRRILRRGQRTRPADLPRARRAAAGPGAGDRADHDQQRCPRRHHPRLAGHPTRPRSLRPRWHRVLPRQPHPTGHARRAMGNQSRSPLIGDLPASMKYMADRFNGAPAPDNCGRF